MYVNLSIFWESIDAHQYYSGPKKRPLEGKRRGRNIQTNPKNNARTNPQNNARTNPKTKHGQIHTDDYYLFFSIMHVHE